MQINTGETMKDRLTKEQSARLIELRVPKEMATGYITELYHGETEYIDVFSLSDLLEILPKEIENKQCISIDWNFLTEKWGVDYEYIDNSYHSAEELIEALYELLCWVIENNYLKQ